MGLDERVARLDLVQGENFKVHAPCARPMPRRALELLHPLLGMREPDRPGHMVVHRVVDLLAQPRVKLGE
jgi:hypothetical protein